MNQNAFAPSFIDNSFDILEDVSKRSMNSKEIFQEKYGLRPDKNLFLVGVSTPMYEEYNAHLLADIFPGIVDLGVQIVFRANGSEYFKDELSDYLKEQEGNWTIISEEEYDEMFTAIDANLVFYNGEDGVTSLKKSLSSGVVPIAPSCFSPEFLAEYNPNQESGNSFLYNYNSPWSLYAALVRAYEVFRFPYDWKNICKAAKESAK